MHIYTHVCMHACTDTHAGTLTHIHAQTHTQAHIHTYTHTRHTHARTHTRTHTHTQTHTQTHTHTHTHTHTTHDNYVLYHLCLISTICLLLLMLLFQYSNTVSSVTTCHMTCASLVCFRWRQRDNRRLKRTLLDSDEKVQNIGGLTPGTGSIHFFID